MHSQLLHTKMAQYHMMPLFYNLLHTSLNLQLLRTVLVQYFRMPYCTGTLIFFIFFPFPVNLS